MQKINKSDNIPVETISAWAVGLRLALAHGSILTLASYTIMNIYVILLKKSNHFREINRKFWHSL
jgi:hypothetical protein